MQAGRAGQSWGSTSPCCPPREVGIISDIGMIELRSHPHSSFPVSETPGSLAFMHGQPLSTSSQLTVHPGPNCSIAHRPWPQTAVWPPRQPEGTSSTSDPGTPAHLQRPAVLSGKASFWPVGAHTPAQASSGSLTPSVQGSCPTVLTPACKGPAQAPLSGWFPPWLRP